MTNPLPPLPLSHSSAELLQACEQRYSYYKIEKVPNDLDYEKSDALALGSAFHKILEESRHEKPASLTEALNACVKDKNIGLDEEDLPLARAMVLKYLRLHQKMGFKVLHVEIEIKTDWFLGYVDAIMEDREGGWWIVDLKTYKSIHMGSLAALPKDPQLNLYAAHAGLLAERLKLDLAKFAGVRWRVVTKSTAKQKKGEFLAEYVSRLVDKHISAYDIPVPVSKMARDERLEVHRNLWLRSQELRERAPMRNYKNCMSYFSPCSYWSKCHGKNFSDMQSELDITME